jgi:flagellar hook assembly protein FlgD
VTTIVANNATYLSAYEVLFDRIPMSQIGGGTPEPTGTDITSTLSAEALVSLLIKNPSGAVVRTLVGNQIRAKGTYVDHWDAKDDNGVPVPDGTYYAILEYVEDGQTKSVDLTNTTGGTRYSVPTGTNCNYRESVATSFAPYEDNLLPMVFRTCAASEWTVFIGPLYGGGAEGRTRTIVNRKVFPSGKHTVFWDGLDDQGNLAHPAAGDSLITGFWRYDLPANAIVMTGGAPELSAVTADPNYFNPLNKICRPNDASVEVNYTVNEDAALVQLQVVDLSTKETIKVVQETSVPAGQNVIRWDGTNASGDYVDAGDYQLLVSALDSAGNETLLVTARLVRIYQ